MISDNRQLTPLRKFIQRIHKIKSFTFPIKLFILYEVSLLQLYKSEDLIIIKYLVPGGSI